MVQGSESELRGALDTSPAMLARALGARELIVTQGMRGACVLVDGDVIEVRARRCTGDRMGAGDVFLASYLLGRVRGYEPGPAARLATAVCSAKIERGAVPRTLDLEEMAA